MSAYQKFISSARQTSRFKEQVSEEGFVLTSTPLFQPRNQYYNSDDTRNRTNSTSFREEEEAEEEEEEEVSFSYSDRVSFKYLQDIRFEVENEPLSFMEAATLTNDKFSSYAMSIRYSQVSIQDLRIETDLIFDKIDQFIESLPIKNQKEIYKFYSAFTQFYWTKLDKNITLKTQINQSVAIQTFSQNLNPLTVTFSTPKKSKLVAQTLKPLDKLAYQIRTLCNNYLKQLYELIINNKNNNKSSLLINNGYLESELRTFKELYGKFVEILIGTECLNILEILHHTINLDSSSSSSNSNSKVEESLLSQRPYKPSYSNIPLKWALIALWQLTKDDESVRKILIDKELQIEYGQRKVARRLDFTTTTGGNVISAITILIDLIRKQPNKHQRLDVLSFIKAKATNSKLVDLEEDILHKRQQISVAIYTNNQYKIAALRIITHLCDNKEAIKAILRHFASTGSGSDIIESIFSSYNYIDIRTQEPVYENNSMLKRLHNDSSDEEGDLNDNDEVVKEALRLIVQLTNSFHCPNSNQEYYRLIGENSINSLVNYMKKIMIYSTTSNREMLFLSMNILANISFVSFRAFDKDRQVIEVLLSLFHNSQVKSRDLQLRDQATTVLANLIESQVDLIFSSVGIHFLISSLEICPLRMSNHKLKQYGDGQLTLSDRNNCCSCDENSIVDHDDELACELDEIDLSTIERIHQKVAVTFARMAQVKNLHQIRQLSAFGGIKKMIDMCKFSYKRNDSKIVLLACIGALKKIGQVLGKDIFRHYNALDIIQLETDQLVEIYNVNQRGCLI